MVSPEFYKHQLQLHNEYVKSVVALAIFGLHKDAMWEYIKSNGEEMTLEHYLNYRQPHIESVQETKQTKENGRWLVITTKANMAKVIKFFDYTLPVIYQEYINTESRMMGYEHPVRARASGNKTVGSYASVLQQNHPPPTSYLQAAAYQQHDQSPITRPNKRIMVDTSPETYEKKNYEEKPKESVQKTPQQQQDNLYQLEIIHEKTEKLEKVEERVQEAIKTIREEMKIEMKTMREEIESEVKTTVKEIIKESKTMIQKNIALMTFLVKEQQIETSTKLTALHSMVVSQHQKQSEEMTQVKNMFTVLMNNMPQKISTPPSPGLSSHQATTTAVSPEPQVKTGSFGGLHK